MIVRNTITGEDITGLVLKYMQGQISQKEFEKLAKLKGKK